MEKFDEVFAYFGPVGGWILIILSFIFNFISDAAPWAVSFLFIFNLYEDKFKKSLHVEEEKEAP